MTFETITMADVRRGDKVKPPGWPNARLVKSLRTNPESGKIWLWFPGNNVHWGAPTETLERKV